MDALQILDKIIETVKILFREETHDTMENDYRYVQKEFVRR